MINVSFFSLNHIEFRAIHLLSKNQFWPRIYTAIITHFLSFLFGISVTCLLFRLFLLFYRFVVCPLLLFQSFFWLLIATFFRVLSVLSHYRWLSSSYDVSPGLIRAFGAIFLFVTFLSLFFYILTHLRFPDSS